MIFKKFIEGIIYQGLEVMGRYYSSYRGYVMKNEDPEGLGRIKVKIPQITKDQTHVKWAFPKHNFSGKGYGMQVLPVLGDIVWVEFEHGDPQFPLWFHGHFTRDEKPEEFVTSQVYGFKTPKGQIIIIDDRDDVEKIIINHGENAGLVKVVELWEMLNKIENKVNAFLTHYRLHKVIDPISGFAGPLDPSDPAPANVEKTEQAYIENENVQH